MVIFMPLKNRPEEPCPGKRSRDDLSEIASFAAILLVITIFVGAVMYGPKLIDAAERVIAQSLPVYPEFSASYEEH